MEQWDEDAFDRSFAVNFKGPYFLSQKCALEMMKLRDAITDYQPAIVNISSLSAYTLSLQR